MSVKKRKLDDESNQTQPSRKRRKLSIISPNNTNDSNPQTNNTNHIFNSFQTISDIVCNFLEYLQPIDVLSVLKATNHTDEKQLVIKKFKQMYSHPMPKFIYHLIEFNIEINGKFKGTFYEYDEIQSIKQCLQLDCDLFKTNFKCLENDNMKISISLAYKGCYSWLFNDDDKYLKNQIQNYVNDTFISYKSFKISKPKQTKYFIEHKAYDNKYCQQHEIPIPIKFDDGIINLYPFVIVYNNAEFADYSFRFEVYKYNETNEAFSITKVYDYYHYDEEIPSEFDYIDAKIFDNCLHIIYYNITMTIDMNGNILKAFQFGKNNNNIHLDTFECNELVTINENGIIQKMNDIDSEYVENEKTVTIHCQVKFVTKDVIFVCDNDHNFKLIQLDYNNGNVINEQMFENLKGLKCLQVTNNQYIFMFNRNAKTVNIYKYSSKANELCLCEVNTIQVKTGYIAVNPFNGTSLVSATFNPVKNKWGTGIKKESGDLLVENIRFNEDMKEISRSTFQQKCIAKAIDGHGESYLARVEFILDGICAILNSNGELFIFCDYDGMEAGFIQHHYIHMMEGEYCGAVKYVNDKIWVWSCGIMELREDSCDPIMFDMK